MLPCNQTSTGPESEYKNTINISETIKAGGDFVCENTGRTGQYYSSCAVPHNALVVARGLESAAVSRKNVVYRSYRWILA